MYPFNMQSFPPSGIMIAAVDDLLRRMHEGVSTIVITRATLKEHANVKEEYCSCTGAGLANVCIAQLTCNGLLLGVTAARTEKR